MYRLARPLAVIALCASLGTVGCTKASAPSASAPPRVPSQTIVFDMAHAEVFGPDDTTQLGQSMAVQQMRDTGFEVVVNQDSITAEDLSAASGLVIAGPMRPLLREEYSAINDFVKRGGTLLLTIHVPYPILGVPAHWGLPVAPFVMQSESPLPGGDAGVFLADKVEEGTLTEGVGSLFVVSGWPVSASADNAEIIVATSDDTWIDSNDSHSADTSESASFGVVGSATVGEGRVIVIGDDAVFANVALGEADNARLLDNILAIMSKALES